MTNTKTHIVIGIVRFGDHFAFLQRVNGDWTFPSGKVEMGETAIDACVREIKEETDLDVQVTAHLGSREQGDMTFDYLACDYVAGDLTLAEPDKFKEASWKTADEIISLVGDKLFPAAKDFLLSPREASTQDFQPPSL